MQFWNCSRQKASRWWGESTAYQMSESCRQWVDDCGGRGGREIFFNCLCVNVEWRRLRQGSNEERHEEIFPLEQPLSFLYAHHFSHLNNTFHNWAAWASAVDGYGMCAARQCDDDNDDVKWASLRLLAAGWRWQWSGGFFRWTRRRKWGFSIPKDLMTDKNSRFSFTILILIRSTLKTFPSGFTLKVMGLHPKRL